MVSMLAVVRLLNVPQGSVPAPTPGVQFAIHVTPLGRVTGSLATVAAIFAFPPNANIDGGVSAGVFQLIETLFAAVIVTVAIAVFAGPGFSVAVAVAIMVTTPGGVPPGMAAGAV